MPDNEKQFESDIEAFLVSAQGGWTKATDAGYRAHAAKGLDLGTLVDFVKTTQPKAWGRFERQCNNDAAEKFYREFDKAVQRDGMLAVLRHGFSYRNISFRVCYFRPESSLNDEATRLYGQNICQCVRQWHYSPGNNNSVDMMLAINGIPVVAIELKNQLTHQSVENAKKQWMFDRDPHEIPFRLNNRVLVFFAADLYNVCMTTRLNRAKTFFLPFDQGSNGAGKDGGAGNPPSNDGNYVTSYFWRDVLQKDKLLDILQKFMNFEVREEKVRQAGGREITKTSKKLIFPRFHQMDVVRKLVADVRERGAGHDYLIQHSAGSGKSNSIAWTAYRLASLHDDGNAPVFTSVIILTDRLILNQQLISTITGFEHQAGLVATIGECQTSQALKQALQDGKRIIVCNIQKFPVIYRELSGTEGRKFAVIVDEAHSSQSGHSAETVKIALGDTAAALREYAEIEERAEGARLDELDRLTQELICQGKHDNLSFFAFTATPKPQTLERFGVETLDGSFHPFHEYSMRQAIEEKFILDVLENYTTYSNCWRIVKNTPDNPDVLASKAVSAIRRYKEFHAYPLAQKSEIIVETFRDRTRKAIGGKGKMMVVTASRLAAVCYREAIENYIREQRYDDIAVYIAFSGTVSKDGVDYTEAGMNTDRAGNSVSENQLRSVFHGEGDILIVAEKYQTGFDEPLLHTMIVDKRLRSVKAVQTLSRLNRTCPGKDNTFILDFVNTADDIRDAFKPFYRETILDQEFDVDNLYDTRKKCRDFGVYTDEAIEKVAAVKFDGSSKDDVIQGRITNFLKPVVDVYKGLDGEKQDSFRALLRSFIKQYRYVAQITRLFDAPLHKEFVLCSYLEPLLPKQDTEDFELGDKVRLEYWKLRLTHEGSIELGDEQGIISQPDPTPGARPEEEKTPLEQIVEKLNERYKDEFTEADRVITEVLTNKLMQNDTLRRQARQDSYRVFESQFANVFSEAAENAYTEHTQAFTSLFEKKEKFDGFMQAIGQVLYQQFRAEARP